MDENELQQLNLLPLNIPNSESTIIKVVGVGGGGGNAVSNMYEQNIENVTFVICNTDNMDLKCSKVPHKLSIGKEITRGLGAGNNPQKAKAAAEESIEEIRDMLLSGNTEMVFITAGMGGGTGTGASPIVAQVAQELDILTVGIVTIPFAFEQQRIKNALEGVASISRYVDALLVINNEKIKEIYPDFSLSNAFAKADDVLTNAVKGISEIITVPGYINIDFADVNTIMRDGKVAIMNTGFASGENRISLAIKDALNSPLINANDIKGAKKIMLSLYCSKQNEIRMEEIGQIHKFMYEAGEGIEVIWGITFDDTLEDQVKITIIATGFDVKDIPGMPFATLEKYNLIVEDKKEEDNDNNEDSEEKKLKKEKDENMKKAIEDIYGQETGKKEEKEITIEDIINGKEEKCIEEESIIDISDLEDKKKLDEIERIPTWKRKMDKHII